MVTQTIFTPLRRFSSTIGAPACFFLTSGALDMAHEFWWDELERLLLSEAALPSTITVSVGNRRQFEPGRAAGRQRTCAASSGQSALESRPGHPAWLLLFGLAGLAGAGRACSSNRAGRVRAAVGRGLGISRQPPHFDQHGSAAAGGYPRSRDWRALGNARRAAVPETRGAVPGNRRCETGISRSCSAGPSRDSRILSATTAPKRRTSCARQDFEFACTTEPGGITRRDRPTSGCRVSPSSTATVSSSFDRSTIFWDEQSRR